VDIVFRVKEKRTGSLNFGASMGQGGVGFGGFIGVEQPNLFGLCKSGRLNWQYGRFFNDFTATYTDPALRRTRGVGRGERVPHAVALHRRQPRPEHPHGCAVPPRFPTCRGRILGTVRSRTTRRRDVHVKGTILGNTCLRNCFRSNIGLEYTYDTRVDMPFPFAGSLRTITADLSGGPLGGDVNFQRYHGNARSYTELGVVRWQQSRRTADQAHLGLTARSRRALRQLRPVLLPAAVRGGWRDVRAVAARLSRILDHAAGFNPSTNQFRRADPAIVRQRVHDHDR
jgi:outer membrane protein insertion porin family